MAFLSEALQFVGARVAANPQDKRVLTLDGRALVITNDGSVFAHDLNGNTVGVPFQLQGSKVASNPQDKHVLTVGNRILVITNDGSVFAHDLNGNTVGVPFQLQGSKVAFNPQDKHVLTVGNRILVITNDGSVFAHDLNGNTVGVPFQLQGPKVASNPQDKHVLTVGNRILVITNDGSVFAHDLNGNTVGVPFQLAAPKVAANSQDKFVLTLGNRVLVITQDGNVFGHTVLEGLPDTRSFDDGALTCNLPLGGSCHLVMRQNGDFTFNCHAHNSGFDNIDYAIAAVLMTPSGIAFTFQHSGHTEGTIAGLPLGTPNRDDNSLPLSGNNPSITAEWSGIVISNLKGKIDGQDNLVQGVKGLLDDALKLAAQELGKAAAGAVIALVF